MSNETSPSPQISTLEAERPVTSALRRPYIWSSLPAFALLGLSMALAGAPLPEPLSVASALPSSTLSSSALATDMIVPASETLLISRQSLANQVLLRGRMQVPAGVKVVAHSNGQVAHVAVRAGQAVQARQQIVALSTSAPSRVAVLPPVVTRSSPAEQAQIAAVKSQRQWQERVQAAHDRFEAAQERVRNAQARVASAREMVQRLQNGEEVSMPSTPAPTPRAQKTGTNSSQSTQAAAESRRLQQKADAAEREATRARNAANSAEDNAQRLGQQWKDAQSAAAKIEVKRAPAEKPSTPAGDDTKDKTENATPRPIADDGSAARKKAAESRAADLRSQADAARERASALRRESDRLQSHASELRAQANRAARKATDLRNLQVFDNEGDNRPATAGSTRVAQERTGSGEKMSIAQAVQVAREALAESRDAMADAERLRKEVESYKRPIVNTRERFDDATRRLNAAYDQSWPTSAIRRTPLSPVKTETGGVVLWVMPLAREVSAGTPVAEIGRTDRMEVVLQDTSGAWKKLQVGSKVMALVQSPSTPPAPDAPQLPDAPEAQAKPASDSAPDSSGNPASASRGVPTLARVLEVRAPQKAGAPALVRVAIHNPRRTTGQLAPQPGAPPGTPNPPAQDYGFNTRTFAPGTPVICAIGEAGSGDSAIAVPSAAIRQYSNGQTLVAVLKPLEDGAQDVNADLCRIEWRPVEIGRSNGFQSVITGGLEVGERIALRPEAMENFTLAHGLQATLRVEQA